MVTDGTPPGDDLRDARLLRELREMATRIDPVPPEVVVVARGSLTWRTIDAELAELIYDSVLDDAAMAGVRGADTARVLTFEGPGLTIEVEVTADGDERRLLGQLVPPQAASLEIRHRGGTEPAEADDHGRFSAAGMHAGPVRITCRPLGDPGVTIETDWVVM